MMPAVILRYGVTFAMTEFWPLFDMEISTPRLLLRHLREADLVTLAATLPTDVGIDPSLPRQALGTEARTRGATVYQGYWRSLGAWTVDSWCVRFGVWHGETLIGSQTLEGDDFLAKRVVDSASFLSPEWRGRGLGTEMRRAVLALAFGELGAEWAVSSAWSDNAASLGVSRALGYEPNGETRHVDEGRTGILSHVRLTRETWGARNGGNRVTVTGFGPCWGMFGLEAG